MLDDTYPATLPPSDQRRIQIIEGAIKVLMEKGVSKSRMNDFVKASGLSKGGVYHYFESKEDLLIGVLNYFFEMNLNQLTQQEASEESAYLQLRNTLTGHQEMLKEMGKYNQLMMDFFAQSPHIPRIKAQFNFQYRHFHAYLSDTIQKGIDNNEFSKSLDAKAIAAGMIGVFDGIGIAMMVSPELIKFPEYAIQSALTLVDGLRMKD